jgi:hypothetical protein
METVMDRSSLRAKGRRRSTAPRWLPVATALAVLVTTAGCAAVLIGGAVLAGSAAFVRGDLEAGLEAPLPEVWAATQRAIDEDLELTVQDRRSDALYAKLVAFTAKDQRVWIDLERLDEQLTIVRIRVDVFGNEALSRLILDKIQARLRSDAPAADEGRDAPRDADEPVLLEER